MLILRGSLPPRSVRLAGTTGRERKRPRTGSPLGRGRRPGKCSPPRGVATPRGDRAEEVRGTTVWQSKIHSFRLRCGHGSNCRISWWRPARRRAPSEVWRAGHPEGHLDIRHSRGSKSQPLQGGAHDDEPTIMVIRDAGPEPAAVEAGGRLARSGPGQGLGNRRRAQGAACAFPRRRLLVRRRARSDRLRIAQGSCGVRIDFGAGARFGSRPRNARRRAAGGRPPEKAIAERGSARKFMSAVLTVGLEVDQDG